ncbi:MAG: ABC transporter permease [Actinobacteria bacterium]|nr:ABC transporter permease [Actinomycetota bacterium]
MKNLWFIKVERIKEILGAIGAAFGLIIYLGSQLLISQSGKNFIQDGSSIEALRGTQSFFLPSTWAPEILVGVGLGDYHGIFLPMILLLGLSIAVFILALLVTVKAYYTGLTRISNLSSKKKRVRTIRVPSLALPISGPIRAIVIKDLKCLSRDMQEWIQFLMPVAMIFVLMFQAREGGPEGMANALFIAVLLTFIMSMVAGRLSLTGVGRERMSIWVIHQAPVERLKIVVAKVLVAYLPSLVLATLLYSIVGFINGFSLGTIILGLMVMAGILLGISALGAMFGSINPKFDAANPQELIRGVGGFTYLISSMMYLAVTLGLFALPQLGRLAHINPILLWVVSVAVLYVVVVISTSAFIAATTKRLETMEVTV